ncbi:MAG: LLM class flavin-dependent oxidoreductase, partial [Acidimicrobiia bacterium]|nr:LLM class flavin-dependent oxidoreductase [Acidimicrobiia bacterium]
MSGETKRAQKIEVGIGLPNFGDALESIDAREAAMAIEHAGFDGIWLTDHLLIPAEYESKYPYSKDGSFFLPEGGWWFESIVTLSYIAAVTSRVRLGIGVCVLPLREPRALSQQLATLDRLSGGRVVLGAGAAWLAEELDALEVPRKARGLRVEGAIELMRQCWTGEPQPGTYGPFGLPN